MGSHFKPWRRRIGLVTLLIACVFTVGWTRSWSRNECVQIPVTQHSRFDVGSTKQVFGFAYHRVCDPSESQLNFFSWPEVGNIESVLSIDGNGPLQSDGSDMMWRIRCGDLAMGRSEYLPDFDSQYCFAVVPYWPIVMVFTVLSAVLLLSQPRSSTGKESTDPGSEQPVVTIGRFMNGWRRKVGLVTLLMACVFAGTWVRSHWSHGSLLEITRRHNEHDQQDRLVSLPGEVVWAAARNLNASHSFTEFFGSLSLGDGESSYGDLVCGIPITWRRNLIGFRYGDGLDAEGDNACSILIIRYWLIVIPLTLISVWLLLSKPCPSARK
jgi:hypothetical protein